jgi:glycosyltransferase involved in cell wall biosynthesis
MRLSIIIPVYNGEDVIKAAISSIQKQSFKDFELLVIDGLSSDSTADVVQSFKKMDNRISLISEKDEGIYDAMNKGIRLAKGEWLYFLGSDDILLKNSLEEIEPFLINGMDVVYGDVISERFGGRYDGFFDENKIFRKNICHQSIFFRKTIFNEIGNFNLKYRSHADWDHNMRWLLNSKIKKKYVDVVVANYADGGYSSLNIDLIFSNDRILNYLKYGMNSIPFKNQDQLYKKEISLACKTRNVKKLATLMMWYLRSYFHA